ncbi:MAG: transcription termination factor NusA [bacterium]|nr:transcription termination factor NusA [bacterium]MDZ4285779.1 transcription termination factor NusA [Candidatus Sungbacteria bacterium]
MIDLKSFAQAIQQIADEKGISREKIIETIEMALAAAYKRDYGKRGQIIRATLDQASGKMTMKQIKIVVDESMIKSEEEIAAEEQAFVGAMPAASEETEKAIARREARLEQEEEERMRRRKEGTLEETEEERRVRFNPEKHLMIEEAREIKKDAQAGDELEFDLPNQDEFGRIAAQTAKQVIIQRVREAEREAVFDEFKTREGEIISGLIQRIEMRNIFVDIGRTVAILPPEEQLPQEHYTPGSRMKFLLLAVEKNPKGPGVFLSRSHPRLLRKLFEVEVPEIASGVVEVKAIAREPGSRSKIAVKSSESGVDPVGSLVGQKGVRVSTVIQELGGEKIDVIEWSEDPKEFIAHALSPAKVIEVSINEHGRDAVAVVPEEQLSLAIGKGGQNVRLAAKLTGWKIDVRARIADKAPVEKATEEAQEPESASTEEKSETQES